jgi:hypothetical protein
MIRCRQFETEEITTRRGFVADACFIVATAVVAYRAGRARAEGIPTTQPLTYSGVLTDPSGDL